MNQNTSRAARRALPPPGAGPGAAEVPPSQPRVRGPCRGHPRGASPSPQCPLRTARAAPRLRHKSEKITHHECGGARGCRARLSPRGPPAAPCAPRPGPAAPRLPRSLPGPALPAAPLRFCLGSGAAGARPSSARPPPKLSQKFFFFPGSDGGCGSGEKGRGARGAHP